MRTAFALDHLTEALSRAHQHWQIRHGVGATERPASNAFTIAFSRQGGTYGAAIAREVAERLGWPLYDRELLRHIADDMGVRQTLLDSVDERNRGWLRETLDNLFVGQSVSETAYFHHLLETLLSLAAHGNCVIVGRGATAALPANTTLRVRVVAPLEHRIEAVRREHSISAKEAAARVETTDRERNEFVRSNFQVDPTDAANYDVVLNAARLTTTDCADIVIAALNRMRDRAQSRDITAKEAITPLA